MHLIKNSPRAESGVGSRIWSVIDRVAEVPRGPQIVHAFDTFRSLAPGPKLTLSTADAAPSLRSQRYRTVVGPPLTRIVAFAVNVTPGSQLPMYSRGETLIPLTAAVVRQSTLNRARSEVAEAGLRIRTACHPE